MKRRTFFKSTAAGIAAGPVILTNKSAGFAFENEAVKPLAISSSNGLPATQKAMEMIKDGKDALDAVIAGVNIVEDDPEDHSVGYGGLPNEDGVVELDACCMHGPTHNAGAVAALRNIKNPSKVARLVMERTDHVLLVGRGALQFAKRHGFKEEELLTDKAREIWLHWKEELSEKDNWFPPEEKPVPQSLRDFFDVTGTITCLGIDQNGDISGVTTTSGLAFKLPGRVGDSPIIGAGLYVDNAVGACGSTGRGEENLKNLTCFLVVELMRQGAHPQEACLKAARRVVDHARHPSLLNRIGRPNFNLRFYALDKKGRFGAASIYGPTKFAVNDTNENKIHEGAFIFKEQIK